MHTWLTALRFMTWLWFIARSLWSFLLVFDLGESMHTSVSANQAEGMSTNRRCFGKQVVFASSHGGILEIGQ